MFRDTYLELTSVADGAVGNSLHRWRADPPCVRLVLLRAVDAGAERARLASAGLPVRDVQHAERRLIYGAGGVARFRWFDSDSVPGTVVAWVQHLDREALFDPDVIDQPNTAYAIEAVHCAATDWPAVLADEDTGNVELCYDASRAAATGTVVGVDFLVRDIEACARALSASGTPFKHEAGFVEVSPDVACGTRLRFRAPAAVAR